MIGYYISFGLISGAIYAVGAIGLSLLLRTTGYRFLAFGDVMAAGAFLTYVFNSRGINVWLSMLLGVVGTGILGMAFYWLIFRAFKGAEMATMLILTIGVAFLLRNFLLLIWGPEPVSLDYIVSTSFKIAGFLHLNPSQIVIILSSLGIMILFYIVMNFTRVGKGIRAIGDDANLAEVRGVNQDKVFSWAWFFCIGLGGFAGASLALTGSVNPTMGFQILLLPFAGMIIGGIGNPYGAAVGGYIVGIVSELTPAVGFGEYKIAVAYVLMAAILLVKPDGLFPSK